MEGGGMQYSQTMEKLGGEKRYIKSSVCMHL